MMIFVGSTIIFTLHSLTGNRIGPEGSIELAPALEKLTNLQKLS